MDKTEARLIAYLLADGGIYRGGDNGYYLYLRNLDDVLIADFSKLLLHHNLKSYKRFYSRAYEIRVGNKKLALKLLQVCKNFRTLKYKNGNYPEITIPEEILQNKELAKEFLQVFASCEGYIKFQKGKWKTKRLTIGCVHPQLRKYVLSLLELFDIKAKETNTQIIIYGKEMILRFSNIGFIEGCKVQKGNYKGIERNKLLQQLLDSYVISSRA